MKPLLTLPFLFLLGCTSSTQPVKPSTAPSVAASPSTASSASPAASAESILAKLEAETHHKPILDTWGSGKGLFLVKAGWDSLSEPEKNALIDYAKANGAKAILVGNPVPGKDTVTIDDTVWGN